MRLLLADHSQVYREALANALGDALTASITEARTDEEVVDVLAEGEPVACVLADLHLPERGGLALARDVSARGGPPVILTTAHERTADREQARQAGAAALVDKTGSLDRIVAAVRAAIDEREQ